MLARALALRLGRSRSTPARVLLLGAGNGRNLGPLLRAGLTVTTFDANAGSEAFPAGGFDAVLATHALLHGDPCGVASKVAGLAAALDAGGVLYATFGSVADPRFGRGEQSAGGGWADHDGPEAGVLHAYFSLEALGALLRPYFTVEAMREREVSTRVGRWAHPERPSEPRFHWLVTARRRDAPLE